MNLEDIAAKAGVSRSTVSRVINDEPYVSEKTRQRVLAVIEQEGFTPNPGARMMVTQRSHIIGIVIPQLPSTVFSDDASYFPLLLQGATEAANERDYAVLLWLGLADESDEAYSRRVMRNRLMDGMIVASVFHNMALITQLLSQRSLFVQIERSIEHPDQVSYVSVDNTQAARMAVTHLVDQGRRCVGAITGTFDIPDMLDRFEGYRGALREAGYPYDSGLVAQGYYTARSGYIAMKGLIERQVDAVFVSTDLMAIGAYQAIHEAGLRIPDDIAVVGFDDIPRAATLTPPLTTVRQNVRQRGARAAGLLIDLIEGRAAPPQQILLPTQLVIRESCGAVRPISEV